MSGKLRPYQYLQDRIDSGVFTGANAKAIKTKLKRVKSIISGLGRLTNSTTNKDGELQCSIAGFGHGDMYELMMIAFYQMLAEQGLDQYDIKEIEARLEIGLRHEISPNNFVKFADKDFIRFSDIIIKGDIAEGEGQIIELKSIQAAKQGDFEKGSITKEQVDKKFASKFPRWSITRGKARKYHRQFFLDNVATTEVVIPDEDGDDEVQIFADSFKWWFHDWQPRYKKDEVKKGKTIKGYDSGRPPSEEGLELVRFRMARSPNLPRKRGKYTESVGRVTLKNSLPDGQWYKAQGEELQVSLSSQTQRMRRFNLFSALDEVARESGRPELNKLFDIPPEIEAIKREIENKAELAQDIIDGIDDADFVNIDTDKYYQKMRDELGDFSNPFNSENCDP